MLSSQGENIFFVSQSSLFLFCQSVKIRGHSKYQWIKQSDYQHIKSVTFNNDVRVVFTYLPNVVSKTWKQLIYSGYTG